jgi:hypothetical protein
VWGLGHGVGAAVLGALALWAQQYVDVAGLSAWSEFLVGFVLIGIGLWALRNTLRMVVHSHAHQHDGEAHQHIHVHAPDHAHDDQTTSTQAPAAHHHSHAPLYVGMLHGAAGTGHLLAVLPALALPTGQAVVYLSCYFLAAIASMTLFGALIGLLSRRAGGARPLKPLMYASSFAAIGVGLFWIGSTLPA